MKEKCFELKEVHDPKSKNMTLTTGAGIKIFIDFKNEIIETIKNGEVIKKATFNEIGSLTNFENYIALVQKEIYV